ncbi:MAG: hypothetical protein M3271_07045 [Actinomycetota bacterium]|nr:hypothetical protein [Actinomycetota bacterium]
MTTGRAHAPVVLTRQPGIKGREAEVLTLALAERYVGLLHELAPEEWGAVTSCDPWTVKDAPRTCSGGPMRCALRAR